jgi:hypothetical protein
MTGEYSATGPSLWDERSSTPFRQVFGRLLTESTHLDSAILRIRLSGVDLSDEELARLVRLRVLVAEVNAQTLEEEAFGLLMDPTKRDSLRRVRLLLEEGRMELRSAPLAGWSPDFSVFSNETGPSALLIGLHWVQKPFPHRGPAWLASFGAAEAESGRKRFDELWNSAYEIGQPVLRLIGRIADRGKDPAVSEIPKTGFHSRPDR